MKTLFTQSFLAFCLLFAVACSGPRGGSRLNGSAMSGVVTATNPEGANIASQVRLRDESGSPVLEYLKPAKEGESEVWVQVGKVEVHPVGTRYFHWGPENDIKHWATVGIKHEEIDQAVRRYNTSDMAGGGFYVSLSPVDSSDYGTNVLVAEPQRPVKVLAFSSFQYNRERQTFKDALSGESVEVPAAKIAEAGIEAIRYTDSWMVCIQGTPLEKLSEGNFQKLYTKLGDESYRLKNDLNVLKLLSKYPPTAQELAELDLKEKFPAIYKVSSGQTVTETESQALVDSLASFAGDGFNSNLKALAKLRSAGSPWLPLIERADVEVEKILYRQVQSQLEKGELGMFESMTLWKLHGNGVNLGAILPDTRSVIDIQFMQAITNIQTAPAGPLPFSFSSAPVLEELRKNMVAVPFYVYLNRILQGSEMPWRDPSDQIVEKPFDELFRLSTDAKMNEKKVTALDVHGEVWAPGRTQYRDIPLVATGDYYLEGSDRPGFLKVTERQKTELEKNPLLKTRVIERKTAAGLKEYFIQYEYPSVQNYQQFAKLIKDAALLADIQKAEAKGELKSVESDASKNLNRRLMIYFVNQTINSYELQSATIKFLNLLRLHPFQDETANISILQSWLYSQSSTFGIFLDEAWAKTLSYPELAELNQRSRILPFYLGISLPQQTMAINDFTLSNLYGVFALAANSPPPHKDPAAFVQRVRSRFLNEDVQDWIRQGKYGMVLRALHTAGQE